MQLNDQQQIAVDKCTQWLQNGAKGGIFRLHGYAGTGKTSSATNIADWITENMDKECRFAAPTGKAASVLEDKIKRNVDTVHRLAYKLNQEESTKDDPKFDFIGVDRETTAAIFIDEASMVTTDMTNDLLSLRIPIIALGDPAQLPPVDPKAEWGASSPLVGNEGEGDVTLTKIMRQADDGRIQDLAMRARTGKRVPSRAVVYRRRDEYAIEDFDVVIVHDNKSRVSLNEKIRARKGFWGEIPQAGERLICLQNNKDLGISNGELFSVVEAKVVSDYYFKADLVRDYDGLKITVRAEISTLREPKGARHWRPTVCHFSFGYAMTCHKVQGSEFDNVMVIATGNEDRRWLYTAITRAKLRVEVMWPAPSDRNHPIIQYTDPNL